MSSLEFRGHMRRREFITFFGGATGVTLARKTFFAAVFVTGASMYFAVGSASADAYKWCSVESDSGGTNCGFVTIEQCRATISGKGGSCQPKQVIPHNLSPAARAAAPKTNVSESNGNSLMECVTNSCKINCSPKIAKRFRPKWCVYYKEPI
jgi:Protein of unknown function (DUF3551)